LTERRPHARLKPVVRVSSALRIATLFVGSAQPSGDEPEELFKVTSPVNGADVAGPAEESGGKMTWPA
jgi:branched-chain amino acid transport system substrate-binding protein